MNASVCPSTPSGLPGRTSAWPGRFKKPSSSSPRACIEAIDYPARRELDKAVILALEQALARVADLDKDVAAQADTEQSRLRVGRRPGIDIDVKVLEQMPADLRAVVCGHTGPNGFGVVDA